MGRNIWLADRATRKNRISGGVHKEQVAMALEQIGDIRVVSVTETGPEQMKFEV